MKLAEKVALIAGTSPNIGGGIAEGIADEDAKVVCTVFLASDEAEMITGLDLRVDAGTISRYWRWNPGATGA